MQEQIKSNKQNDATEILGKNSAILSLIEIGLGSYLHAFKIPFAGHILSLNQIAFLSRATVQLNRKNAPVQISLIASSLKSLSPAGKKLTPMMAILIQGVLFQTGIFSFGINIAGLIIGIILSSLWAFVQPLFFIYLLFGQKSVTVAEYYLKEINLKIPNAESFFLAIILFIVLLKVMSALFISFLFVRMSDNDLEKWQAKLTSYSMLKNDNKKSESSSVILNVLRELFNPLFVISLALSIGFFIFSNAQITHVQLIWFALRPVALGFILFYIVRVYPVEKLTALFRYFGFTNLSLSFEKAVQYIRETRGL